MKHPVTCLLSVILSWLFIISGYGPGMGSGYGIAKEYTLSYPDALLMKLGATPKDIAGNQGKFKKDPVHAQWMSHVRSVIPDIDPDRAHAVGKIHRTLLYLKGRIDGAYLKGGIDQKEFNKQSALLMHWFQEANRSVLGDRKCDALFGLSRPVDTPGPEGSLKDGLGFPIENPETTPRMIKETFDAGKIVRLRRFYREHSRELEDFKRLSRSNKVQDVDAAQIAGDMKRIKDELQTAYRHYCRKTLTNEEFKMIFGKAGDKASAFSDH